jgi:DNA transformation protein
VDGEDIRDLFAPLGPVNTRRMFGGHAIYRDGRIFALEIGGEIYIKAAAYTADLFREAGSRPFSYARNGKVATMGYWLLPDTAADDPEEAARWARLSLAADDLPPRRRRRA